MMKIRPHRSTLEASLRDERQIEPTREAIAAFAMETMDLQLEPGAITVKPYGHDARVGKDLHVVECGGFVVGFCDAPLPY